MIDSHCHLADRKFAFDLDVVVKRARDAGVTRLITISDSLKEGEKCIEIADKYPGVFCAVGVHPHASKNWKEGDDKKLIGMVMSSDKVAAIGEIGLDYYYDNSPREIQREVFEAQLKVARDIDAPVVVHCRDAPNQSLSSGSGQAISDIKRTIDDIGHYKIVIHCCTEKWEDIRELVDRGLMFGFTGIATYPKCEHVREVIRKCPLGQIMIETDSPYLAPERYRGRRNEPAFVVEVARLVAQIKGISLEEADRVTTEKAVAFFGKSRLT